MLSLTKTIARQNNYVLFHRPYELNIWGFRSASTRANVFDDEIHVFYKTTPFKWEYHVFKATTDPGTYWLYNPMQPQGTAILKQGQYRDAYAIGWHLGKYLALTQVKPVTVIRDYDRNSFLDFGSKNFTTGLYGINIHRAMENGSVKYVDKFSAGCQVFSTSRDFYRFMEMCYRHRSLYGNRFTYTLVDHRATKKAFRRKVLIGTSIATAGIAAYLLLKPESRETTNNLTN